MHNEKLQIKGSSGLGQTLREEDVHGDEDNGDPNAEVDCEGMSKEGG